MAVKDVEDRWLLCVQPWTRHLYHSTPSEAQGTSWKKNQRCEGQCIQRRLQTFSFEQDKATLTVSSQQLSLPALYKNGLLWMGDGLRGPPPLPVEILVVMDECNKVIYETASGWSWKIRGWVIKIIMMYYVQVWNWQRANLIKKKYKQQKSTRENEKASHYLKCTRC